MNEYDGGGSGSGDDGDGSGGGGKVPQGAMEFRDVDPGRKDDILVPEDFVEQHPFGFAEMTEEEQQTTAKRYAVHSPISIPENAKIKVWSKPYYEQIRYTWEQDGYKYSSRWHTNTPNAPKGPGFPRRTWVVTRQLIGSGKNKGVFVKVGNEWIPGVKWDMAVKARKRNIATIQQLRMLKDGHWSDEE